MSSQESPIYIENEWSISENRFDPVQIVTTGSNFMTGNGYLGYRGTFPEWEADEYVGCIVSDTYDNADGKWKELCNVPNGLYTTLQLGEAQVHPTHNPGEVTDYRLSLNYRYGCTSGGYTWKPQEPGVQKGTELQVAFERFASYSSLHLLAQRVRIAAITGGTLTLSTGVDGRVWSLNGEHFRKCTAFNEGDIIGLSCATTEKGIEVTVAQGLRIYGATPYTKESGGPLSPPQEKRRNLRQLQFELQPGDELVIEQMMTVFSGNDTKDPYKAAIELALEATENGYEREAGQSARVWDALWNRYFIHIDSSDTTQALLNYNLYHNIIATPSHTDHLPIGARGLSCQAYQGAAFWDQEIFNLPMYLYTYPEVARNILIYRYKTLDGARRKAKRLGYEGAYYAWISGDTGDELCPDYFFKDVLTGRKIRNHFNDWQIHISPDISYAIQHYYQATGDWEFIKDYGAEMLFEIANFLVSHAYFKKDKNRYEIIRVLGPDEYHENADNNAFTNFQAKWAIGTALDVYTRLSAADPHILQQIAQRSRIDAERIELWKEMHVHMYIPSPDAGNSLIEQFDGYFGLEDIMPDTLAERLKDPNEYWGWPTGIAYETQVIKQADVVQLFCLHPESYSVETMQKNYRYYEPRTHHRSSLSPAVHSIVAARIGFYDQAYSYFRQSLSIDLFSTNPPASGGTFIGGIHTAACGIAWQMVVFGFAGIVFTDQGILCNPQIPQEWSSMQFSLHYRGQSCLVSITADSVKLDAAPSNQKALPFQVLEQKYQVQPGESISHSL
ncbi:MAG: glycosyl hydrolase family 65 protein [Spirochaetia bacterium]